ncbi:NAD(P)H-dependent oxidoreductase [Dactylosporangium sp. AC04546]|uniref:FMN-dependent NADH-azoreductase n=1 Tax=Dactylosporangium sp. AC04546 TaxID=2862460 RepID=UPI001EDEA917|nr:NAD(P)H-dependent oxidoreductase [Dactylosporangium sp. AC04546]WVK86040.1 NAD(P)H-dependent oxidoreductase [Dactylosporangium sp. AC04546]
MHLFRLDASVRTAGSVSRALADTAEQAWLTAHPGATTTRRDLGREPLPSDAWPSLARRQFDPSAPENPAAAALVQELGDELLAADAYVFAIPLYNWGVPAHVKAWFDLLGLHQGLRTGEESHIAGRPAVLAMSRGGGYGPGAPKEGWDHNTPYLKRILADVYGLDLHVAEAELTLADVNPAMAPLRGLAAESLRAGHESAAAHGQRVAELIKV